MNWVQYSVSITDTELSWFHSYVTGCYQRVAVDSITWVASVVKCTWANSVLHTRVPSVTSLQDIACSTIVIQMTHKFIWHWNIINQSQKQQQRSSVDRLVIDWYGKKLQLNIEKSEAIVFLISKQWNDFSAGISVPIGITWGCAKAICMEPRSHTRQCMQAQVAQIAVLLPPDTQHGTNLVKHPWWCIQNPDALAHYCTLIHCYTAFRRQAFAMLAKLCSLACLSYEKIWLDHSRVAAFAPVTGLCVLNVQGACVCFLGHAPSTVLLRGTTDTMSTKSVRDLHLCRYWQTCCTDGHVDRHCSSQSVEWTAGQCQERQRQATVQNTPILWCDHVDFNQMHLPTCYALSCSYYHY